MPHGLENDLVKPLWFEDVLRKVEHKMPLNPFETAMLCRSLEAALWTLQFYGYRDNYDTDGSLKTSLGFHDYGIKARETQQRIARMRGAV